MTLTTKPVPGESAQHAYKRLRPKVSKLIQRIRSEFGPFEAAIFTEQTDRGTPHWHIVFRGPFIPQTWLSKAWCKLTGAFIVDIRAITNAKNATAYVAKYVMKQASKPKWERLGRIVTFTSGYLIRRQSNSPYVGWQWFHERRQLWEVAQQLTAAFTSDGSSDDGTESWQRNDGNGTDIVCLLCNLHPSDIAADRYGAAAVAAAPDG